MVGLSSGDAVLMLEPRIDVTETVSLMTVPDMESLSPFEKV